MPTKKSTATPTNGKKASVSLLPEQRIKLAFQPKLSRIDGTALLTFMGYEHSISRDENPFLKLIFGCYDITEKNPANIAVICSYRYSEINKLGRTLGKMGFTRPEIEMITYDEDDEFGYRVENLDIDELIYSFLNSKRGTSWKAELIRNEENGLYNISIETIQPFKKNGVQMVVFPADNPPDNLRLTIDMMDTPDTGV